MNDSFILPNIIYGTAWKGERTEHLVSQALITGFRAFDTANQPKHYAEKLVGKALLPSQMTEVRHGKIPDWYNKDSEYEEAFNEDTANSITTNLTIENILKKYKVKSYISPGMLKIAKLREIQLQIHQQLTNFI